MLKTTLTPLRYYVNKNKV